MTIPMSTVSKAQQAFLPQVRQLVEDLRSFASLSDLETQSLLNSVLRTVNSAWKDYLPLERDAVVDNLLALLCETCARGSLDVASSTSAASLWTSVGVALPPKDHDINYPHVWRHISDKVTELTRPYKSKITDWTRGFKDAVSPDRLRRLDEHAQGVLVQCLEKRTQGLWVRARPESVPAPLDRFPTADDCLVDAQYDTQTVGARFDTYSRLLGAFARLYETKGGTDMLCARHTALETHKHVARQHFALLRDQEHAFVVLVRAALAQACRQYVDAVKARLPNPLPPAHRFFAVLLQPLLDTAGAHLAATEQLHAQHSMPSDSSMHSLAHAGNARSRISDHYCRRYYGTTAAIWAARQAG